MKVYKVVRRDSEGRLTSAVIRKGAALVRYVPGEKAQSVFTLLGYGLLVFKKLQDAKEFFSFQHGSEIWSAEAEDEMPLPNRVDIDHLNRGLLNTAIAMKFRAEMERWPEGTSMFRTITLNKCVKKH